MPETSAWQVGKDENLLLWAAAGRPELCGLRLTATAAVWTGGHSYLHRPFPIYDGGDLAGADPRANFVVARAETLPVAPYEVVDQSGPLGLLRRDGHCAPPPLGYRLRLPPPPRDD